jgi:ArsR family transcriptional regulator, arsenate/arsenite/antimonite-responsive transcriptional repressor
MTNNKSAEFNQEQQKIANYARILSHPARIAIIQLLAREKEIKTGNISDYLPLGRTTVSRHLKELRSAGIIQGTIEGLKIHYCLDMDKLQEIKSTINTFLEDSIYDFTCSCKSGN